MRSFREIADAWGGTDKCRVHGYEACYETHFEHLRDKHINLLEIGIGGGDSLRLWEEYFPLARIHGIDVDPGSKAFESSRSSVYIGDQADSEFLAGVAQAAGSLDIVIDDGSHLMDEQQISFMELFPRMCAGSYYVIEDLETSYYAKYGGGEVGKRGTTVSMLKAFIDDLNVKYHKGEIISPAPISGIHFYKNIAFIVRG